MFYMEQYLEFPNIMQPELDFAYKQKKPPPDDMSCPAI